MSTHESYYGPRNYRGGLLRQVVQLTVTPLTFSDDCWSLDESDSSSIEINSNFIDDLELDINVWGFSGKIDFTIPYSSVIEDKYALFFKNTPLQLDFTIKLAYLRDQLDDPLETSINSNITLTAIAGLKKGTVKKFSLNQPNVTYDDPPDNVTIDPYTANSIALGLEFQDVMTGFLSNHWGISVTVGDEIQIGDFLNNQISAYTNFFTLDLSDESNKKVFTTEQPFITMNCSPKENYSLYDLLIEILYSNGLSLFYDYSGGCSDGSSSDGSSSDATAVTYTVAEAQSHLGALDSASTIAPVLGKSSGALLDISLASSGVLKKLDEYNLNINASCSDAAVSSDSASIVDEFNEEASPANNQDAYAICASDTTDEEAGNLVDDQAICEFSPSNPRMSIKMDAPFYDVPILPLVLVEFPENLNIINMGDDLPNLYYIGSKITICKNESWSIKRELDGALNEVVTPDDSEAVGYNTETDINEFENDIASGNAFQLFDFNADSSFLCLEDCLILLPEKRQKQPLLRVLATVYTTSDAVDNKTKDHLVVDYQSSEDPATTTVKAVGDDDEMSQAYWLTLPGCLAPSTGSDDSSGGSSDSDSSTPLNIPFDIYKANFMPNFYSLLRSGTQVLIDLCFMNSELVRVYNYMVPEDAFAKGTDSQNSHLCFVDTPVDDDTTVQGYISHAYSQSKSTHSLSIETVNSTKKSQSVILRETGLTIRHNFDSSGS